MSNTEHLLSKINMQYQSFSKGQKKLAAYIKENYDKAAFLTAAKLGETVGVSESTVVALLHIWDIRDILSFKESWRSLCEIN